MTAKILLLAIVSLISITSYSQRNTNTGTDAGSSGLDNTSIGYKAGDQVTGPSNTFLGSYSGRLVSSNFDQYNTFLGAYSGYNANGITLGTHVADNVFVGYYTGYNVTNARDNVFLGSNAGRDVTTGSGNTAVGCYSKVNSTGGYNTFLGYFAGQAGSYNVALGGQAGSNTSGNNNVYIGYFSGDNSQGSGNIFIGYRSGFNETTSNKLYIDNSDTTTPLIYGDFSGNKVGINSLPNTTHTLTVGGTIHATGLYVNGVLVSGDLSLWERSGTNVFTQSTSDNIGIGTTLANNPNSYKLAVNGKIGAKEVQIENTSLTWPDFVFESDYKLMSLTDVEAFIKANGHLPEVPSQKQVAAEGIKVSELNAKLLQKIEELTLYVIELKKEVDALKNVKE